MSGSELQQFFTPRFGRFFRGWIQDPLAVGSIVPSGRLLARLMVSNLRPGARVIELGAGTGTVTQAILDTGVRERDLCLVELNDQFVDILSDRYPRAEVVKADALNLTQHLQSWRGAADFVVSGLPLLLFSSSNKKRVLSQAFELLKRSGAFHQFTYAGRCPISQRSLAELSLTASRLGIAALNLPPAFVYSIARPYT